VNDIAAGKDADEASAPKPGPCAGDGTARRARGPMGGRPAGARKPTPA